MALNSSFPVSRNEISRSHPTQYTRKCSAPSLAQYKTNNERGVVHESSLLENNANYLFSNDNQLAASFPQESKRDAFINSEPTDCKPFSVPHTKPADTSSQMSNFWIPPPINSAKQEGGFGKALRWHGIPTMKQFSTRSLDDGNMRDSFLGDWTSACNTFCLVLTESSKS